MSVLFTGCNNKPSEEAFEKDSRELYVQIFKDGEQSETVQQMHKEYTDKYEAYSEEELYSEIDNLYNSFDNGEDSSGYLTSVMNILNK